MNQSLTLRKNPVFGRCPSCDLPNSIHRSRARSWKEKMVKSLSYYKIYRCSKCGWRGYLSTITLASASMRNFLLYLLLGTATAFIINQILTRMFW